MRPVYNLFNVRDVIYVDPGLCYILCQVNRSLFFVFKYLLCNKKNLIIIANIETKIIILRLKINI